MTEQISCDVVIPAYNAEDSVVRAIESAIAAGVANVIVVDDGSRDRTAERAAAAGATCVAQENSGAAKARVKGAKLARSKYLIFLDADDELISAGTRESVKVLESDPSLAVAAGTVVGVGRRGMEKRFPVRYSPVTTESLLVQGYGPWPPCAAVISTAAFRSSHDMKPEKMEPKFAEDYELLIRLSMVGGISVRNEPTGRYSLAGGKSVKSALSAIRAKEAIRAHYAQHLDIEITSMNEREMEMAARVRIARAYWASGYRFRSSKEIAKWAFMDPASAVKKLGTQPWKRN
ncbi:glycosyltransferase family A protein [Arthrobacter sp. Marseille-P9274]|uniref:glycosyltransferase family A protein n=1 Tax=Arthrobacter sp. Marseille-P9274 TaxID=2866572 RepID=UPI0021C69275|nr:glycosyltransferase family A protein [Arthrobacter sp. Marseille-P9274]